MTSQRRLRLTARAADALLALAIILAFTLGFLANVWWPYTRSLDHRVVVSCEEDEPCWDCHTMGNRICGPTK